MAKKKATKKKVKSRWSSKTEIKKIKRNVSDQRRDVRGLRGDFVEYKAKTDGRLDEIAERQLQTPIRPIAVVTPTTPTPVAPVTPTTPTPVAPVTPTTSTTATSRQGFFYRLDRAGEGLGKATVGTGKFIGRHWKGLGGLLATAAIFGLPARLYATRANEIFDDKIDNTWFTYTEDAGIFDNGHELEFIYDNGFFRLRDEKDNDSINWESRKPTPINQKVEEVHAEIDGRDYFLDRDRKGEARIDGHWIEVPNAEIRKILTDADFVYNVAREAIAGKKRGEYTEALGKLGASLKKLADHYRSVSGDASGADTVTSPD